MTERTYSEFGGKVLLAIAGGMVVLALANVAIGERLTVAQNLLLALALGLGGADQIWWRGTNRWFRPAMLVMLLGLVILLVLHVRGILVR